MILIFVSAHSRIKKSFISAQGPHNGSSGFNSMALSPLQNMQILIL